MALVVTENGASRPGATPERAGHILQPGLAVCQHLLPPRFGHSAEALAYEPGREAEGEVEPENQRRVSISPRYQPGEEPFEVPAVLKNDELFPNYLGEPDSPPTAFPGARPIDGDRRSHVHASIFWHARPVQWAVRTCRMCAVTCPSIAGVHGRWSERRQPEPA